MTPSEKKPKKSISKIKKLPKIPANANVKIIEITLSKVLTPLAILLVIFSIFWTFRNMG